MNRKEKSPAGMILRAERIRQGKGQKEVCYGICVVSYLSKIERGSAEPDMAILKQLFARLEINYETDSAFLTESRKQMDEFFYNLQYGLEKTCRKIGQAFDVTAYNRYQTGVRNLLQ